MTCNMKLVGSRPPESGVCLDISVFVPTLTIMMMMTMVKIMNDDGIDHSNNNDDIYNMMQCLCVTKNHHFPLPS